MCGIPVIVTDACGIASSLKSPVDAIVVKAGDADSLRLALKSVSDPAVLKRLSDAGRATAGRVFSLAKMVDHYEQLLKES
jgi:glycosyltransferase involved in cell wall biosynthesis